jgi:hypothetical protein
MVDDVVSEAFPIVEEIVVWRVDIVASAGARVTVANVSVSSTTLVLEVVAAGPCAPDTCMMAAMRSNNANRCVCSPPHKGWCLICSAFIFLSSEGRSGRG